jgi:hypothetical protein
MAGLGTTGPSATRLGSTTFYLQILFSGFLEKKCVAKVATLKPPKEDGGF